MKHFKFIRGKTLYTYVIIFYTINLKKGSNGNIKTTPKVNSKQSLHVVVNTEQVLTEQLSNTEWKACVRGGVCVSVREAKPVLAIYHFLLDTPGSAIPAALLSRHFLDSVHCPPPPPPM